MENKKVKISSEIGGQLRWNWGAITLELGGNYTGI